MSTFDHPTLIQNISHGMGTLRKAQPEAMQGFGQLAKAAMTEGAVSEKHKELIALAIGISTKLPISFHRRRKLRSASASRAVPQSPGEVLSKHT